MVTLNPARRNSAGEKTKTCNKRRRDIRLRSQPVRETRTRGAMNNNLNKSRAYLGVFSDAGYIDVGTKVRDPSAPRAPARSPPFPPSLVNPFQAPRQANSHPEPTRLTSLSPPRSTGEAPALPHQGNPPSEISRQAVRRQPAEDRLLRRQGASQPPRQFPDSISRNGTRKSRCSPHPSRP